MIFPERKTKYHWAPIDKSSILTKNEGILTMPTLIFLDYSTINILAVYPNLTKKSFS